MAPKGPVTKPHRPADSDCSRSGEEDQDRAFVAVTLVVLAFTSIEAGAVDRAAEDEARAASRADAGARSRSTHEEFLAAEQLPMPRAPAFPMTPIFTACWDFAPAGSDASTTPMHIISGHSASTRSILARMNIWASSTCSVASPSRPARSLRSLSACAPRAARNAASWPKRSWHRVSHRHLSPTSLPPSRR